EEDLPWPQPDREAGADAPDDAGRSAVEPVEPVEAENEPEEHRLARRARRQAEFRRRRRIVALVAGAALVVVMGFVLWYELESHALGPPGKQVVIIVKPGESTDSVISALSDKGVIGSSLAFQISDFIHGSPTVQAGGYAMHQNQTFAEVRALLAAGPNIYPVDVRPGNTLSEVATQVSAIPGHTATSFEKAASSGAVHSTFSPPGSDNLEGMLGVGQYLILPGESDLTTVQDMVTRFDQYAQAAGLSTASAGALGMTPYQVITVASITEKEGYYTFNMPKVARVIYNRLAQDIALQMDSTVLYAIGQDGGPVTSHDLQIQSPYNSYLNKGLTPTPICMPSVTALKSALNPPPGAWLYFVLVQKNGVMAFSDTYAEQQANEQLAKSRGLP
ncbi:MAG TPA: endolytic transglycosylase MltG, partial [Acidimicrobiales bacterium]|nr:endolytic transglycosylase MltG [Acidimicrobiales bacterium]